MSGNEARRRPIRSFVIRGGRLTPGQRRAYEQHWDRLGCDLDETPLDLARLFGNDHPVWLEIGFGNGESLVQMASAHPERNYLGLEVHPPGVGHCLLAAHQAGIGNLRVIDQDAMEVLQHFIPTASLAAVQLFFPDPWHKKKHHKRRIVQPAFADLLARLIQPGGLFHAATDWQDYAEHIVRVFEAHSQFENCAPQGQAYVPRPQDRPLTKFERRGQKLGHGVWDIQFRRKA